MSESEVVKKCSCNYEYQDKRYGQGMRVHTPCKPATPNGPPRWRCTVCGTMR